MRTVAFIAGLLLVLGCLQDVFEAVLLPRRVDRKWRFMYYFYRWTWYVWLRLTRLASSARGRENLIAIFGPLSMVLLFSCWGISLILGFGFLQWTIPSQPPQIASFNHLLDLSADAFFTLGVDYVPGRPEVSSVLIFLEAATGFGFIALMVSYLPVLYQHFTQRDARLVQLDSRAGTPATAGTLILRYASMAHPQDLATWLREWEVWAAELIETHSAYPMLAFYRSQHANQSWLASLAVILDTCTFLLSFGDDSLLLQAGSSFRAARGVLQEICVSLGVSPASLQGVSRAQVHEMEELKAILDARNCHEWTQQPSEIFAHELQLSYEANLQALSSYLLLKLPAFSNSNMEDEFRQNANPRNVITKRLLGTSESQHE